MVNKKDDNSLEDLMKIYSDIEIPSDLDNVVNKSIERGRTEMKENKKTKKIFKFIMPVAVAIGVFIAGINISPTFAKNMENIPGIGTFVSKLTFNNNSSNGGKITDGSDIASISLNKEKDFDIIQINFGNNKLEEEEIAPHFNIKYANNPSVMEFSVSGVRGFSAKDYFDDVLKSEYIKDIYPLITLDDSMQRFNIVFNKPVEYEVNEFKNPSYITVKLSNQIKKNNETIYSIRSKSYDISENFAQLEEVVWDLENKRVLKDDSNEFLYELEQSTDKQKLEKKLKEFHAEFPDLSLFIETRKSNDLPKNIK